METTIATNKSENKPTLFVGNQLDFLQEKSAFFIFSKFFKSTNFHNSNYLPTIA
ncbi:MAG: hypothetical protein M3367_15585 [Acidobacteriota bacterium]|nr:hypothetical protein [Acidobacteriota bacterium]